MVATWIGCRAVSPGIWSCMNKVTHIVEEIVAATPGEGRKGIKSVIILVLWEIWLEWNSCTFQAKQALASDIVASSYRAIQLWRQAGARCLALPFVEPPTGIG